MELRYHAGGCCGVKTICGFFGVPEMPLGPKNAEDRPLYSQDRQKQGWQVHVSAQFYWPEAPQESRIARLQRYINFCKEQCGSGLIEVTLSDLQFPRWESVIFAEGFENVAEFVNGNSNRTIRVYHLKYSKEDES